MGQNSQHKEDLQVQIREAYGRVVYTYTSHHKMMNRLIKKNRSIKYTQIILSAISTAGFLSAIIANEIVLTVIGGVFSTALLAINLFFKDFNLIEEIELHRNAADNFWIVREDYISLLTDFSILEEAEIMNRRDMLQARVSDINRESPKTDPEGPEETQEALKSKEEQFFTPEEIDKILPSHLRTKK